MPPDQTVWRRLRATSVSLIGQMDWFRGLRAAVALCAPLILGSVLGVPDLGWAALGGFEAILADIGGPYRTRMTSLAMLSLGGACGVFLGSLVGGSLYWALPVTVLWCFAWSYLAVLGQPFSSAGLLIQVIFVCGVGAPASTPRAAILLGILLLAGGAWATILSLFLWPIDPYRPARTAIGDCYNELASFLGSVADLSARRRQPQSLWHRLGQHHQYRVRRAVERGWEAVAHVRSERLGENPQAYHFVVLLESADLLIARTVALAEHLETQARILQGYQSACVTRGVNGLQELRIAERMVAALLTRRRVLSAGVIRGLCHQLRELPPSIERCIDRVDPSDRFMLAQVTQGASLLETAMESASMIRVGRLPASEGPSKAPPGASVGHFGYVYARLGELRRGWNFDLLAANLTRDSLTLRHAARVAIVCGLDVAIILALHINHGYWLLMTSLIVLQPHVSGTLRRGLERIGGTVGGGIVAALLAMTLHSQGATAAALFPCALLALAILPVSYAAYAFFLTPAFVLAWMPYSGDWQLALIRIANTLVGALLSVAAMLFLFPAYERERAAQFLRASLAADRRYLGELAASWRSHQPSTRELANARRRAGLAHNDTEESLDRLLSETWPRRRPFARFATTFVTYLRRFAQGVTTLTALEGDAAWKQSPQVQSRLALLDQRLAWLEKELMTIHDSKAQPWPEMPMGRAALDHPGERQIERLERQTGVLHTQFLAMREHGGLIASPAVRAPLA